WLRDRRATRHAHRAVGQAGTAAPASGRYSARRGLAHGLGPRRAARRGLHGSAAMTGGRGTRYQPPASFVRVFMAVAAFTALSAQREPILVPEVSQHEI